MKSEMNYLRSVDDFSFSAVIMEELAERQWTSSRLATEAGLPADEVDRVLAGGAMGPITATAMGRAFGVSAGFLEALEAER